MTVHNKIIAVVEPGKTAWKMIVDNFGQEILLEDGNIDRKKLGQIIFQDESKRRVLNRCTHPSIQKAMIWQVMKHFLQGTPAVHNAMKVLLLLLTTCTGKSFIVLVSPLLYESGRYLSLLKRIIVVNW